MPKPRTMAAGRIIGGIAGLGLVGASYMGVAGQDDTVRDEAGNVVTGGDVGAFRIRLGDCIQNPGEGEFESVAAVPCAQPHDSEVYHAFMLADRPTFPGMEATFAEADEGCYEAFGRFVGQTYENSTLDYATISPTEVTWNEIDDREVLCLIYDSASLTSGTLRDSRR